MIDYTYDLHVHSCLSPCADNDNTPNNLAGMAFLNGIRILALTDHNTCGNCPAFFEAAKRRGIVPVPGMELTTAEEIHVICLFPELEAAMAFHEQIRKRRIRFPNRKDIFGDQLIVNGLDEVIGEEADYLSNATSVSMEEVPDMVETFRGVCYPAHIDREANGIVSILGTFPETPFFPAAELWDKTKEADYRNHHPVLRKKRFLISSDAHFLTDLREENDVIRLPENAKNDAEIRRLLIETLKRTGESASGKNRSGINFGQGNNR